MRVDLHSGADAAIIADLEPAAPVEHNVRADPRMLADFHIADDEYIVVTRRSLAEVVELRPFPAIGKQVAKRKAAAEALAHAAAKLPMQFRELLNEFHAVSLPQLHYAAASDSAVFPQNN